MTTTDPLDVLQSALDAATPGPWISDSHELYQAIPGLPDITGDWLGETCRPDGDPLGSGAADAAAIVALRNAAPDLLAAIRKVRAVVDFVADCADGRSPLAASAYRDIEDRLRAALGSFGGQQ